MTRQYSASLSAFSGVPVLSATAAGNLTGQYDVTFQVPANVRSGPAIPLALAAFSGSGGPVFANGSAIPIY